MNGNTFTRLLGVRNIVVDAALAGMFSSALELHAGIDLRIFYLIIFVSFALMFYVGIPKAPIGIGLLAAYLLFSACLGITQGTDSVPLALKQCIGILVCALYFYNVIALSGRSYFDLFRIYAKLAYWISILGFFLTPVQIAFMGFAMGLRFKSVFLEPAAYVSVCLPAYYFFAANYFRKRQYGKELLVMTTAMILTGSSTGYLGIAFGAFLLFGRNIYYKLAAPILVAALLLLAYAGSSLFRTRMDDTVKALTNNEVEGANLSTYALVSNLFIAENAFAEHPVFGNGIGSHKMSHDRFIALVPGVEEFEQQNSAELNAEDAASMFLRIMSELGTVGLVAWFIFMFRFRVTGASEYAVLSSAILVYFFVKLLRGGHFFTPEQYFFVVGFVLNYRAWKQATVRTSSQDRRDLAIDPQSLPGTA